MKIQWITKRLDLWSSLLIKLRNRIPFYFKKQGKSIEELNEEEN